MKLPSKGGCQCEGVRYRITSDPVVVYACHCTTCQTQSGSAQPWVTIPDNVPSFETMPEDRSIFCGQ
jgi:hypothetical protein